MCGSYHKNSSTMNTVRKVPFAELGLEFLRQKKEIKKRRQDSLTVRVE